MKIKEIIRQIESTMLSSGISYMKNLEYGSRKKIKNTFCDDCNSFSVYMILHDDIWKSICNDELDLFLCPKCMEVRLGRKLSLTDLKICNVNYPYFFSSQFYEKDETTKQ